MTALGQLSRDLETVVARAAPAVVGVEQHRGHGSGFVLAPDGYVLTNAHVARGADPVRVRLSGSEETSAERVGLDARTDLAVLRVAAADLPHLALAPAASLAPGALVIAIGNPLGFERSVTVGVVSALDRTLAAPDGGALEGLLQTDAAVNPGNSGGPLLASDGAVVGVTTAMLPWARGMAFAIPARTASWVAAVLMRDGEVQRRYLGVAARGEDLAPAAATVLGRRRGVRVLRVVPGTPADGGGLRPGDLLVSAGGEDVAALDDLQRILVLTPAARLALEVLRGEARVHLELRPAPARRAA